MARINIDDDLESKYEFEKLTKILGDADCARGKLVRFFRLAQKAFIEGRPLTEAEITENELTCMPASGWAIPAENGGYRAKGEKEQFSWISNQKKVATAGGSARAKGAKRDKKGRLMPAGIQPQPAGIQPQPAESSALTLTLTPTLSLTNKDLRLKESARALSPPTSVELVKKPDGRKSTAEESKAVSKLIGAYIPAWQQRHNTRARPNVGGVQQGILRRLIRDHPTDYLCELIQVYCQMRHKYFDDRKHDLATFERGFNEIALAHARGDEDSTDWAKIFGEKDATNRVSGANSQTENELQRKELPGRANSNFLDGLQRRAD